MARKAGRTHWHRHNTAFDLEFPAKPCRTIIEFGALRDRDGVPVEELTMLVCVEETVPAEITALTWTQRCGIAAGNRTTGSAE